jgi:tetratricopeptide (TPR) repeat protein
MRLALASLFVAITALRAVAVSRIPQSAPAMQTRPSAADSTLRQQLQQATALIGNHRLDQAEALLDRILDRDKDQADALNFVGVIRAQQGRDADAEDLFRRALAAEPRLTSAHVNLGVLDARLNKIDLAQEEYEAALAIDPENHEARSGLVVVAEQLAVAAKDNGRPNDALAVLLHARKLAPHQPRLLYDTGMLCLQMNLYQDAAAALVEANQLEPANATTLYALARTRMQQQKMPEAEQLMRHYLQMKPDDASAHYGLGRILTMLQRPEEARVEYNRSIELQPVQTESYYEVGQIDLDAHQDDAAHDLFDQVLKRAPQHGGALTDMGILAFRKKDYASAETWLKSAVGAAPEYSTAHYYYGLTLRRLGRKDEADQQQALSEQLSAKEAAARHSAGHIEPVPEAQQ